MNYILYNPLSDNRNGKSNAQNIEKLLEPDEISYLDVTPLNTAEFLENVAPEDKVILSGGDGTLHHFVNECGGVAPKHPIYYYPSGSGNDFMTDVQEHEKDGLVLLNPYLQHLPTITVNGQTRHFLNGVGYGIDGYCCEEGDKQRAESDSKINYAAIAIKGMISSFKPREATVTVDGATHYYKNVWLAPTMNGRFYGGGMMIAPGQWRLNDDGLVTTVVMHCKSKLKTLTVFPSIFKGEHVRHTEMVEILTGHDIEVSFNQPTALQIDGETIPQVSSYCVHAVAEDIYTLSNMAVDNEQIMARV